MGRCTRFLPRFAGLGVLLACYQRRFPQGTRLRIDDFDGDLKLDVNLCETIGINLWHAPDLYERRERQLFCSALRPGCTVLDVGANLGIYTLLAAKRGAKVFAVEADPANASSLRGHVALNGCESQVSVHEMAAVARETEVCLFRNRFNSGGSSIHAPQPESIVSGTPAEAEGVRVAGRTIDSLQLPPIDVCKIDIEGAEIEALEGMTETLQRSPGMKLLIECLRDGPRLVEILRRHFRHIAVVEGRGRVGDSGLKDLNGLPPPAYCNLWARN